MDELPLLIQLLQRADILTEADVKELLLKLKESPNKTVPTLLLESGHITERELQSLQLAAHLLAKREEPQ
ncbi:MAG TPA: hypothetical protein V6C81_20695 [Planktothrix sp.]|jgi:hypothetical protein